MKPTFDLVRNLVQFMHAIEKFMDMNYCNYMRSD